jgi:hypothetical protein
VIALRASLLFAFAACRSPATTTTPTTTTSISAAPSATYAIKDPKVIELMRAAALGTDDGAFVEYTIDEYAPEDAVNQVAADKLETCAYAVTDPAPALHKLALECMSRETVGIGGPATPLRAHIIATLVALVDHEPDPALRREAVFVLAMIERDVAHDPKLVAKLNALARRALATDPELAALAWIPSTELPDAAELTAAERAFALALLAADLEPHVYDVPFAFAPTLDQPTVCAIVGKLLRPDARSLERAVSYVLQDGHCPALRDAAVDIFAAKLDDLFRTSGVDVKLLTPAQHARLHGAAIALRARAKDPQAVELYLRELLQ